MQNPARFLVVRPKLHLVLKVLAHQSSSCIRHLVASNRLLEAQSPEANSNLKLGHHIFSAKSSALLGSAVKLAFSTESFGTSVFFLYLSFGSVHRLLEAQSPEANM